MKAITYARYGPPEVLTLSEVEKPVPADNEILVNIKATAVNSADVRLRKADPFAVRFFFGLTRPKIQILGIALAGEVEAVGKDVKRFKPGDQVFGLASMKMGTYAEYISLSEDAALAVKPPNVTFEEAAAIPFGGHTALHFFKQVVFKPGLKVLICGASGAVGTAAVQLAKHFGAEVTGICSTSNAEMVRAIGADHVINYTREDFSRSGITYDVVFDTVGKTAVPAFVKVLDKKGTLILGAAMLSQMLQGFWQSMTSSVKLLVGEAKVNAGDMNFLKELMERGEMKAIIDKRYPLAQMVEAHRYVDTGRKKGNVVITMEG